MSQIISPIFTKKMQEIKVVITLSLISISSVWAQTLREAVHESMVTHPEILISQAQTRAAEAGISEAKGAYYPSVDVNAGYGREWTESPITQDLAGDTSTTLNRRELDLALVQNLYSGGSIVGEVQRNKFSYQSLYYKTISAANDMALNVTEAYLNVLLQQTLVRIAQVDLAEHHRLLKLIKERSDAGITKASELDQALSRVALAESNLVSAEGNLREAMVRFRKFVGDWPKNLTEPLIPATYALPKSLEKALQEGLNQHPLMKSAAMDIKEAQAQYKVANGTFFPKVDAVLSGSRNKNLDGLPGKSWDNLGMIRVSYNVFKGGGDLGRLKKTAYQVQQAFETRNKTMVDLKELIRLAFNSWDANTKRTTVLAHYVRSTARTKAAYFEQFQIGQRSFLDLLNTQSEETRAKIDYFQARNDEVVARFRILNGIGCLLKFIKQPPALQDRLAAKQPAIFSAPIDTQTSAKAVEKKTSYLLSYQQSTDPILPSTVLPYSREAISDPLRDSYLMTYHAYSRSVRFSHIVPIHDMAVKESVSQITPYQEFNFLSHFSHIRPYDSGMMVRYSHIVPHNIIHGLPEKLSGMLPYSLLTDVIHLNYTLSYRIATAPAQLSYLLNHCLSAHPNYYPSSILAYHQTTALPMPHSATSSTLKSLPVYSVQLAAFTQQRNAQLLIKQLNAHGYPANYTIKTGQQGATFNVTVGHILNKQDAILLQKKLASLTQLQGFLVKTTSAKQG